MKKIEFRLSTENIADLLRGRQLVYKTDEVSVCIYPENYGFFITPEKMHELKRAMVFIENQSTFALLETILKEASKPITPV